MEASEAATSKSQVRTTLLGKNKRYITMTYPYSVNEHC